MLYESSSRDQCLQDILAAYLQEVEAGKNPDREKLLAQHPGLAEDLRSFLAENDKMRRLVGQYEEATLGFHGTEAPVAMGTAVRYFGDYELVEEIGRGGMGVVYKARQVSLKRIVALKMILAGQFANDAEVRRFHAEAEAAAKLDHPGIVPVFEVGLHDGHHYFAMAFVEGQSLAHQIVDRLPSPRQAAELIRKVAEAVAFAHVEGVIHRDLKPGNILIDKKGQPRLTDFGLAKRCHSGAGTATAADLTATGQILGTPSYMPPEQASGKGDKVGPLSDVYSLGAVLYCLLTGRPPFQSDNPLDTLLQVVQRDPVSPRQLNAAVPRDLETICLKCLAKEPHKRYPSAQELVADLDRFLAGQPIQARPIGGVGRAWRWCRRKPALAAASGLAASALLAAFSLAIAFAIHQSRAADHNRRLLAESYLDKGQTLCEQGDVARGTAWLVRSLETTPNNAPDLQRAIRTGLGAWYSPGARLRIVLTDRSSSSSFNAIGVSADAKTIVTATHTRKLQVWDAVAAKLIGESIDHKGWQESESFSPDGKWLAVGSSDVHDATATIWDTATMKPVRSLRPRPEDMPKGGWNSQTRKTAFSADGKILLTTQYRTVQQWDVATGNPIGPNLQGDHCDGLSLHKDWIEALALSPDGKIVATGARDNTARLWDAVTGKPLSEPLPHGNWVRAVAFSPDGKTLATGTFGGTVGLWDVTTGKLIGAPLIHRGFVYAVAFSPDGKMLLTAAGNVSGRDGENTARLWDVATLKPIGLPLHHVRYVQAVAFSHDGKSAITTSQGEIRIWDLPDRAKPAEFVLTHQDPVTTAAFSPDGKIVGIGSFTYKSRTQNEPPPSSEARLWDAATGLPLGGPLPRQPNQESPLMAAFSPDGKTFALLSEFWDWEGSRQRSSIHLWDVATRQSIGKPLLQKTNGSQWSPGGQQLAFAADGKTLTATDLQGLTQVWDLATGQPIGEPKQAKTSMLQAFSADGKSMLRGHGEDHTAYYTEHVKIDDMLNYHHLGKTGYVQHQGIVDAVAISPDGTLLLTGSADHTARLWDAATQKPIGPPMKHEGPVRFVGFSADGKTILTTSNDKTARLWPVPPVVEGNFKQIVLWPQVTTGTQLGGLTLHVLRAEDWDRRKQEFDKLGGPPLP